MRDIYRVVGAVLVVIVAALGIGAALHIFMSLPFEATSASDKRPEWTAAFGTVGALIAAIYLARTETRMRERADLVRARLHASAWPFKLIEISYILGTACEDLEQIDVSFITRLGFDNCRAKLDSIPIPPIDVFVPMVPLSGNVASILTQAFNQIEAAPKVIDQTFRNGSMQTQEGREDFRGTFLHNLKGTKSLIDQAIVICSEAAVTILEAHRA